MREIRNKLFCFIRFLNFKYLIWNSKYVLVFYVKCYDYNFMNIAKHISMSI